MNIEEITAKARALYLEENPGGDWSIIDEQERIVWLRVAPKHLNGEEMLRKADLPNGK